eukprot:6199295-Pleurochrysis_carterae.AAC.1
MVQAVHTLTPANLEENWHRISTFAHPGLIPGSRNHTQGALETAPLRMRYSACKFTFADGQINAEH